MDDNIKMERWQLEQMAMEYHRKALERLLSRDPVLQIRKPKRIGEVQGPKLPTRMITNPMNGIIAIIQLLHDAGYVAGVFVANKLLESAQDQVTHTCRSLYEKLAPLRGYFKQIRRSLIPLEDISLDCRSKHQRIRDQIR